jgi:hypothetical protein
LRVIITPENFAQFSGNPRGFLQQVAVGRDVHPVY